MSDAETERVTFDAEVGPLTLIAPAWTREAPAATMLRHLFFGGAVIGGEIEDLARILGDGRQGRAFCGRASGNGRSAARSAIEALARAARPLKWERRLLVVIVAPDLAQIDAAAETVAQACSPHTDIAFGVIGGPDAQVCLVVPDGPS